MCPITHYSYMMHIKLKFGLCTYRFLIMYRMFKAIILGLHATEYFFLTPKKKVTVKLFS